MPEIHEDGDLGALQPLVEDGPKSQVSSTFSHDNSEDFFDNPFKELIETTQREQSECLVAHFMASVVSRLSYPHYKPDDYLDANADVKQLKAKKVSTSNFLSDLVELSERLCEEEVNERPSLEPFTLELNLAGGVVRTLLAHMYKTISKDKDARKHLDEKLVALVDRTVRDAIEANTPTKDVSQEQTDKNNKAIEKVVREQAKRKSMLFTSTKAMMEQRVRRDGLDDEQLVAPFVLGVGSDIDVFYSVISEGQKVSDSQKKAAERVAFKLKDYINSVEDTAGLRNNKDMMKGSILPAADVKDYEHQLNRVLKQGGSMLDALALTINPKGTSDEDERIVHVEGQDPQKAPLNIRNMHLVSMKKAPMELKFAKGQDEVIQDFLQGFYEYVSPKQGQSSSQKQAIRGLRPLIEIPFLNLKDDTLLMEELEAMLIAIEKTHQIDDDAVAQYAKMIRNANFGGGANRAYRERGTPMAKGLEIARLLLKLGVQDENSNRLNHLLPRFLQTTPEVQVDESLLEGKHYKEIKELLMNEQDYLSNYTDEGQVYHGTSVAGGMNILRGGFITSTEESGAAIYGPGTYVAKDYQEASTYAGAQGIVLPVQVKVSSETKIIHYNDLLNLGCYRQLVEEAKPFQDKNLTEVESVVFLLRDKRKYGVDIIVNDEGHSILQNANALDMSMDLNVIADWFESQALNHFEKFRSDENALHEASLWKSVKTYLKYQRLIESVGVKVRPKHLFSNNYMSDFKKAIDDESNIRQKIKLTTLYWLAFFDDDSPEYGRDLVQGLTPLNKLSDLEVYCLAILLKEVMTRGDKPAIESFLNNPSLMERIVKLEPDVCKSACRKGCYDVLEAIVKQKKLFKEYVEGKDLLLINAIVSGDSKIVDFLLEHTTMDDRRGIYHETKVYTLMIALKYNRTDIMKSLLDAGYNRHINENFRLWGYGTPMHLAIIQGNADMVEVIMNCQEWFPLTPDDAGRTPFMLAAYQGQLDLVKMIYEKEQSRIGLSVYYDKYDALMAACHGGHSDVAEFLLKKGIVDPTKTDNEGLTALSYGIVSGSVEVVQLLLNYEASQCDINSTDEKGRTPLMEAVVRGQSEVVKLLLEHGACPQITNNNGYDAFDLARAKKQQTCLELLEQAKSKMTSSPKR